MLPPFNPGVLCRTINAHIGMPLAQQVMGMQTAHDALIAIQQVLPRVIQLFKAAVQRIEGQRLHLYTGQFERMLLTSLPSSSITLSIGSKVARSRARSRTAMSN